MTEQAIDFQLLKKGGDPLIRSFGSALNKHLYKNGSLAIFAKNKI